MSTPTLSIITVVYNGVATIEKTILSVINQANIEYIMIDGNSTDGTVEVIKKYEAYLSYFVSEPDKGIYDAMNKGLAMAKGTYVGFKNSGDLYLNGALLKVIELAEATNADVIYGNTYKVWDAEQGKQSLLVSNHHLLKYRSCLDHRSAFVKRVVHRPFDLQYRLAADYDLFCQLLTEGKKFQKIEQVLSTMEGGGASDTQSIYKEIRKIQQKYFGFWYAEWNQIRLNTAFYQLKIKNQLLKLILGEAGFVKFKARQAK